MTEENKNEKTTDGNIDQGKLCAGLAYFLIGILWFFADDEMKKNDFVKFHVKQGLLLIIISFAVHIAVAMTFVLVIILPLVNLAVLVMAIIGVVNVVNGEKKELPFIGQFANKFKF